MPATGARSAVTVRLLAESVLIVASVLLALAVDEWRDGRSEAERVDTALAAFAQELEQNLGQVEQLLPYHVTLRARFDDLAAGPAPGSLQEALSEIPEWHGIALPGLLDVAWDAALASGVLPHMEYDLITALARVYRTQAGLDERGGQGAVLLEPQNLRPDALPFTLQSAAIFLDDVVQMERVLYCLYDAALDQLRESASDSPTVPLRDPDRVDTLGISGATGQPVTVGC